MKKLTISVEDSVYKGLRKHVGPRKISRFLNNLARSYVVDNELRAAYVEMAKDRAREAEAQEWTEALIGDVVS